VAELPSFADVKSTVESSYPTPIASVFRRCRVASKEDLGGRHKNLVDLFEVFTKFLCIVQLQEARQKIPNLKDRLPQKEKTLQFLKRPSLGGVDRAPADPLRRQAWSGGAHVDAEDRRVVQAAENP